MYSRNIAYIRELETNTPGYAILLPFPRLHVFLKQKYI